MDNDNNSHWGNAEKIMRSFRKSEASSFWEHLVEKTSKWFKTAGFGRRKTVAAVNTDRLVSPMRKAVYV